MRDNDALNRHESGGDLDMLVRSDRLQLLFRQSSSGLYINLVVTLLLYQVLREHVRPDLLFGWLLAICIGVLIRFVLFELHRRRKPQGLQILAWELPYAVTLSVSALTWGLGVLWFMMESELTAQLVEFIFLLGMAGGTMSHYMAKSYMAIGALFMVLAPATAWFLLSGQSLKVTLSVAAMFFMGALIRASWILSVVQGENFRLARRMEAAKHRAELMAHTDELTELDNRRAFFDRGQTLAHYCERQALALTVLMIDADHFKQINDRYGHAIGDAVLQKLASELKSSLRKSDLCARIGGEEFALLLPDTSLSEAVALAERFRESYAATPLQVNGMAIHNTISIGVASDGYDLAHLLHCADIALYLAKSAGRDQVVAGPRAANTLDAIQSEKVNESC